MEVHRSGDAAVFERAAGSFLLADPYTTSVIGTNLERLLAGHVAGAEGAWMWVSDTGAVVGVAMQTPPMPLIVSRMPSVAASALAAAIVSEPLGLEPLVACNGERAAATAVADAVAAASGAAVVCHRQQRFYRLGSLRVPEVPGAARRATADDVDLVADWLNQFDREARTEAPMLDAVVRATARTNSGEVWLWTVAGEPGALGCIAPPASGAARIGPVYTPPAHRRRGYGAAVTAHAATAGLDQGASEVVLYADLANPTSNGVYLRLGFEPDHDLVELRLA